MPKKLAIIIPVYRATHFLQRALSSIIMQTALKDIHLYLVYDGEEASTYENLFGNLLKELTVTTIEQENQGPGVARQAALDKVKEPYVMFVDSDDTLSGAHVCERFLTMMEQPEQKQCVILSGKIQQQEANGDFTYIEDSFTWVTGKIYKKSFLDKYDIRFTNCRLGEDASFLRQCTIYADEATEKFAFLNAVVYDWHWNEGSLVRSNVERLRFINTPNAITENCLQVTRKAYQKRYLNVNARGYVLSIYAHLYCIYNEAVAKNKRDVLPNIIECAQKIEKLFTLFNYEDIRKVEHEVVNAVFMVDKYMKHEKGIIAVSYPEFKKIVFNM